MCSSRALRLKVPTELTSIQLEGKLAALGKMLYTIGISSSNVCVRERTFELNCLLMLFWLAGDDEVSSFIQVDVKKFRDTNSCFEFIYLIKLLLITKNND